MGDMMLYFVILLLILLGNSNGNLIFLAGGAGSGISFFLGKSWWSVFARSIRYSLMSVSSGGSSISLCNVNIIFVRSLAAAIMIWSLVAVGIGRLCGSHFTLSHMRVESIAGVQMLWQR